MENSLGNLAEYVEVFHAHPNQLGGFIWDFADQSLRRPGPDGQPRWCYGGDFGETPTHRYFCNNGILGPDRQEHPSAREVFWAYRPLVVRAVDAAAGRFEVANRFGFTDAAAFDPVLELRREGSLVAVHELAPIAVAPGARAAWELPEVAAAVADPAAGRGDPPWSGELVARIEFRYRDPTAWAAAGDPVGFDEFVVVPGRVTPPEAPGEDAWRPGVAEARGALTQVAGGVALAGRAVALAGPPGALAARGTGLVQAGVRRALHQLGPRSRRVPEPGRSPGAAATIRYLEDREGWLVQARSAAFRIDGATGHLASWRRDGREVLAAPLRPNSWRALTDNDRGYGNIDQRLQDVLVDTSWRDLRPRVTEAHARRGRDGVTIELALAGWLFDGGVLRYRFAEDGSIEVHHALVPLRDLVRIGLTMALPDVQRVRWYGKGPHEHYIDRARGAWTALHELPIEALPHHYVRPQENGNRTEVRWLEAVAPHLVLRVEDVTGERLGFTAWPWSQEHLDATEHDHELVAGRDVTLNVDRRQRGVGGDLPGMAALLPQYTLPAGRRHEVTMRLSVREPD
jgi:beta-galactosidase